MIGTLRKIFIAVLSAFVMVACVDNDPFNSYSGDSVNVTFSATLDNGNHGSRAGESQSNLGVTHMRYQVFTSTMQSGSITETFTPTAVSDEIAIDGSQVSINVDFVKNQQYRIVFLAYNKQKSETENYPYIISDDLTSLSVDYGKYTSGHDLFYAVTGTLQIDASGNLSQAARTVTLKRPFATIALGTDDETEEYVSETVSVSFINDLYTHLDLTTGYPTAEGAVKSLSAVVDKETTSSMTVNNKPVYKFASFNVLTHPNGSENVMSFTLADDGVEKTDIPVTLTSNYLVKVAGDIVEVRAWDGVTFTAPKTTPDKCSVTGYALHVETPDQLAYLLTNGTTATSIHICNDMDMGGHALSSVANLPEGTTISGLNADGERKHIIFNLQLNNVSGLFGDIANNLKINNLEIGGVTLNSNSVNNAGILLGKATGLLEMTNVTVDGCTVNGSRNVGGMVGYIDGNATFTGCVSKNVTTTASGDPATLTVSTDYKTIGAMVGVFKGNGADETLTFDDACSVEGYSTGAGAYVAENQSCWVADGEESWSGTPDVKYDNALGNEEFCRGTVTYGGVRIVPHWDGIRRVAPIGTAANGTVSTCEIWSPFDLAYLQERALTSVTFKSDVDMDGKGKDGAYNVPELFTQSAYVSTDDNGYKPITSVTNLDGKKSDTENYAIYNLCVNRLNCETGNAFISYAYSNTTHKNLNLVDCQTVATHKLVESDAKAYGAIFVSGVDASGYVMDNIHAVDCKVFALQKIGTLASRVAGNSTLKNCSVTGCYIENYECNISERFDSGQKEFIGQKARIYADFFPHGEVGGMFGFVQGTAAISDCHVNNTIVHAYGQEDKMGTIEGSTLAVGILKLTGYFLVPGRHVSTFIGDVRATGAITIDRCNVDSQSKCTNRYDSHNKNYTSLGQCYYILVVDNAGTVKVDGKSLTLANCNQYTRR